MIRTVAAAAAVTLTEVGAGLQASSPLSLKPPAVHASAHGSFTLLPQLATIAGDARVQQGRPVSIGYWNNPLDTVSWSIQVDKACLYNVSVNASSVGGTDIMVDNGEGATATMGIESTGNDYSTYKIFTGAGVRFEIGKQVITIKAADPTNWHPLNIASVTLSPTNY